MSTTCRHMISMCAKTHLPCPHAKLDGECEGAECGNDRLPTFRQMGDIYLSTKKNVGIKTRSIVLPILRRIAETAGLTLDSKVALGVNEWELIYRRLLDGTHPIAAHEGGYDPATIKMWFSIFTRCAGLGDRNIRIAYAKKGLTRPDCDAVPNVDLSGKSTDIEELTPGQVDLVMDRMTYLRLSKKTADRRRFVWMWFALFFGVRPADIGRLKWDCIKDDPGGGKRLEYVPHKTDSKTNGRSAAGFIHPKLYRYILPYIGAKDEYVIPRKVQHVGMDVKKHGWFCGEHMSLRSWVNKFMRNDVKVKGHMAGYLLRRNCSRWVLEHLGPFAEETLLGHSGNTRDRNYVNRASVDARRIGHHRCCADGPFCDIILEMRKQP